MAQTAAPRKRIYNNILETLGGTPLVELHRIVPRALIQPDVHILVKLEYFNPASSVKDRVAVNIVHQAIADGRLKPGMEIIEATSGNTGIGLALAGSVLNYPVTIVMPETMSAERQMIIKAYGARLVLTPGAKGMAGAVEESERMMKEHPGKYFLANQFGNPDNAAAHVSTATEIWEDTDGAVDVVVSAIGTSGTIVGVSRWLKQKKDVKMVGVEPKESSVLQGKPKGPHGIQGIGAGFVPALFDRSCVDELVSVETQDAWAMARALCRGEGIMCGMSSGCATLAALRLAKRPEMKGKTIVVVLPSCGERYLSTALYKTEDTLPVEQQVEALVSKE